jgi:hypothetical protein
VIGQPPANNKTIGVGCCLLVVVTFYFFCSDLPAEIQAAYVTLGWYKAMWEAQAEPDSEDLEWDDLSQDQQAAASKLGYDKGTL